MNRAALDHLFICCAVGAPEASALEELGLREGSSNTHPGQGTACRRFFFVNAYLELLWVSDPAEAHSEAVRRTRLWDRWRHRGGGACPFGIVLRPAADTVDATPPFPTWSYRPSYLPSPMAIEVARNTPLSEPEIFYVAFQRGRARPGQESVTHGIPVSEVTGVTIGTRGRDERSPAAAALEAEGLVTFHDADEDRMEMVFDRASHGRTADLRPTLPLILSW